jgi:hypothetical protein
MALPWVRLDSSIASHDKILALLDDRSPNKWQAATSYMFALGWSGEHGTDGRIPTSALPFIHGTPATARLLVKHGLWDELDHGYNIHNFAERQELKIVSESKRAAAATAGRKANCVRWHGADCHCWKTA